MPTPTIPESLKYVSLQMAAEAVIRDPATGVMRDVVDALVEGNKHTSKFTKGLAEEFVDPIEG